MLRALCKHGDGKPCGAKRNQIQWTNCTGNAPPLLVENEVNGGCRLLQQSQGKRGTPGGRRLVTVNKKGTHRNNISIVKPTKMQAQASLDRPNMQGSPW